MWRLTIFSFHGVYWPALLMALNLPLPSRLIAHAHWTLGKQKMSKSTGVVVNPFFAIDRFGIDTMRFFLMFDGKLEDDSEYGNHLIIERYNKILRNALGNLATRVIRSKKWNVREAVVATHKDDKFPNESTHPDDVAQYTMLSHVEREVAIELKKYRLRQALHTIMKTVHKVSPRPFFVGIMMLIFFDLADECLPAGHGTMGLNAASPQYCHLSSR